ncbi:MAG: mannose-1-phosphate guanylyltransferase/mannose-6-phosphate isomerase [Pseudomonadota bacterium]
MQTSSSARDGPATSRITPVLLCGGAGTRLWPLSRKSYPKQFAALLGEETLLQATARRLSGADYAAPVAVTNADFRFIVAEQLSTAGFAPSAILIEPESRNTAPALLAAALYLSARDPRSLVLATPCDHLIGDTAALRSAVAAGRAVARAGGIVAFGVAPSRVETGYGHLELAGPPEAGRPVALKRFVEKPDATKAAEMMATGHCLWNAGLFLMSASTIIDAVRSHAPGLLAPVGQAVADAKIDLGFLRLAPEPWARADEISIDYAVMERADNLSVVPLRAEWADLGGWDAVWHATGPDARGVALSGRATAIDCADSLLRSEAEGLEVVGLGVKNVIAVAMTDAVLVADRARAKDVGQIVGALRAKGVGQATEFPKEHRPWGWSERLVAGDRFQVKRLHVRPGAALSLQSHVHRAEHWIVVEGTARVTIDGKTSLLSENQSVFIPLGAVHRLENPGKMPMVLIEVQTGGYFGEDDIVRYEDLYARE